MFDPLKKHICLLVIVMALLTPAYLNAAEKKQAPKSILDILPFKDPAFRFQCLWRFGSIAAGGGDFAEMLTAARDVVDNNHESWYQPWAAMADHTSDIASKYLRNGNLESAQAAFFRAANYYRAAEIYVSSKDPRGEATWKKGRNCFLKACELSKGLVKFVEIPFEDTVLPAYWCRVDDSGKKRPLLIVQTGLDGTAEDLYFIVAPYAVKRGYNCLIFEGPGQGEVIRIKKIPFRHNWETVVTPVVDYALKLAEVDPEKIALIGYSMAGYLVPRAMAFEHRIKYCVVDSGVLSVFDGLMTKFAPEVKTLVDSDGAEKKINKMIAEEQKKRGDIDQFINQMLWTFGADSPFHLFRKLKDFNVKDCLDKISCEMLVIGSVNDQVAGSFEQAKLFYAALRSPKTYLEFSDAEGAQFHCQIGSPMNSIEQILNWLDKRLK
jgi:hypothetical protein